MKAKEAPEKIYLRHNHKGDIDAGWLIFPLTNNDIEYIRTDAFIEKACEWLENHNDYLRIHDNGKGVRFDMTQCVIDFRKAMKK